MEERSDSKWTRREFLRNSSAAALAGGISMGLVAQGKSEGSALSRERPNIVFVFSDQQRWDTLGCYGQSLEVTPNLDRMAKEGVRFEHAFSNQPLCGPARACIQTGKYATESGCYKNEIPLPAGEKTLAHRLSDAGYEVGYLGKWHLASSQAVPPVQRGGYKDYWLAANTLEFTSHGYDGHLFDGEMKRVDFKGYRVDCLTDFALDYLRTRDRKRPFFLFMSFLEPHHQNDDARFEGPNGSKERFKDFVAPGDLVGTRGDWRESYPDYLGACASLDRNLGRLRAELEKLGLAENTLIVYTSDHGCHFRTRNREYKRTCHEDAIRVPLIAYGPGFRGGKVVQDLVSLVDITPTLLAAGGVGEPAGIRGRPLQELASGEAKDWPKEVLVQISEDHIGRALRTPRWKYSLRAPGGNAGHSDVYTEECLYDLEKDPHERNNLVRDPAHASVRRALAGSLIHRMEAIGEKAPKILPAKG